MPQTLVLATRNKGKLVEFRRILDALAPGEINLVGVDEFSDLVDVEETGSTFEENSLLKARYTSQATGLPAIADDSGLCVDALNGDPGIFSARWAGEHGNELMDRYSNRTTRVGYQYPMHMLLQPQYNLQSTQSPSMYGVTKLHFQDIFDCTTDCDTKWISITQQLCDYGCHRKQSLVQVHVTAAEAQSHIELLPEDQEVMVCR
ncbi:MAG: hypothetical protein RJA68_624, partial [Actinomycetota bacterium]